MTVYSDNEVIAARRRSSARRTIVPHDPDESFDELYARRRQSSRDSYYPPRAQSVDYVEDRGRRPSRVIRSTVQRRYNSVGGDSQGRSYAESDCISPRTIPHRSRSKSRRRSSQLALAPCIGPACEANDHKVCSPRSPSDLKHYSVEEEALKAKKLRNNELLAAGLASITTVAAANNIYQSSKKSKERREEVRSGMLCEEGARSAKSKAVWMDLLSVGVAAVCVSNAVNGWKNMEKQKQETERVERKFKERRDSERLLGGSLHGSHMGSVDWSPRSPRVAVR